MGRIVTFRNVGSSSTVVLMQWGWVLPFLQAWYFSSIFLGPVVIHFCQSFRSIFAANHSTIDDQCLVWFEREVVQAMSDYF